MSSQPHDDLAPASTLRRRELLRQLLAGAAGVQLTAWIGACRGEESEAPALSPAPPPSGGSLVQDAWSRAQAARKTLVVIVIPADPDLRWEHGRAFGHLLQHGSEATLARIGGCELVCAEMAQVREVLAGVPGVPVGECTALVVAQGQAEAVNTDLTVPSPWDDAYEQAVRDRIARLESALGSLLDGAPAGPPLRYRETVPPGAAWATDSGCGVEVDGREELSQMVDCGMGNVPAIARRFLYYLVQG